MRNLHRASQMIIATILSILTLLPRSADATIVEFETVLGNFEVNLYDNATPNTVANFLNYVQTGGYTDSIIHRVSANFIVQGGGFKTDINAQISPIAANASVVNEPVFSNVRGTIAMAKVGGDANSATNQWFFNLANNAANLDDQNGGFTVFGEVTAGMAVIDAIAALPSFPFAAPLGELPLQGYSANDFSGSVPFTNLNLIIVTAVTVIDSTPNSAGAAGLNPTPTTAAATTGGGVPAASGGGGGGGTGLLALLVLSLVASRRTARR